MKWTRAVVLLLPTLAVASTGAIPPSPSSAPPQVRVIVAGPVSNGPAGISGTFRVEVATEASHGPHAGIASDGTGGACLVFSRGRQGGATCHADAECRPDPVFPGGAGYCLHHAPAAAGRCWSRPAETPAAPYCLRSPHQPVPLDVTMVFPRDAQGQARPIAHAERGWWRVHACLNGAPMACASAASPDAFTDDGPPSRLR